MMSKLEFDCKIAHLDEVKRVSNFNSIKELYQRISQTFLVPINEILYCTINTHNSRDMSALLGNYLSCGDLIIVHMCGESKELCLKKSQEYLGLTITDNGNGRAFVKKVKPSENRIELSIKPGDHISAINSRSTVGLRHYEVAKAIREIPERETFILTLTESLYRYSTCSSDDMTNNSRVHQNKGDLLAKSTSFGFQANPNGNGLDQSQNFDDFSITCTMSPDLDSFGDLANSSLPIDRLLSKSTLNNTQIIVENDGITTVEDPYRARIDKINSILESFLGINDNLLAIQIYRLAKENKDSLPMFAEAIRASELSVFNFDADIENYLWKSATEQLVS